MIQTDIIIIGAGPVGLFTVFEAGLLKLRCHLIDALPYAGGQLKEIYPGKPIFDIPGFPEVLAGDLIDNLLKQIEPFQPGFTLGERVETLEKDEEGQFSVITNKGTLHRSPIVCIANGLGAFEPRKPPIENLASFEGKGVEYFIKNKELYRNKEVVISGGGDSALDWAIQLAEITKNIKLVHRRSGFRGVPDSVEKVKRLNELGKLELLTDSEVVGLDGKDNLESVLIRNNSGEEKWVKTDAFIPLFGLLPKPGPIANWGLEMENNAIKVNNSLDYQTNIPGVYAVGDGNTYPGKLKLILCGFHEATLFIHAAYKKMNPDRKNVLKYTTVNGVTGFSDAPLVEALEN